MPDISNCKAKNLLLQIVSASPPNSLRLDNFIAALPCMAFRLVLSHDGQFIFTYASEGCRDLLECIPSQLENDASTLTQMIQQEDRAHFLSSMHASAQSMGFWGWEGRINLPDGNMKWLTLGSSPRLRSDTQVEWEGLIVDVTRAKLDELELIRSQEQLREFSSHIQDAKEQERLRIAREVHDEIGGLLTAIKMDLAWLKDRLPKSRQLLTDKVNTIEDLVDKAATAARNLAHSLRPGYLDSFGIIAAIETETGEFEQRTGIHCQLTYNESETDLDLDPDISIALYRIFQECLTNIMKHAQASRVRISVSHTPQKVELNIEDNGKGFSQDARNKPRSFGLRGIHERVSHFGGTVNFTSTPGQGTTVSVSIPLTGNTSPESDTLAPQQDSLF